MVVDTSLVTYVTLIFVLAGLVKGIIGFGLPTLSLALLVLIVDIEAAMAILIIPSLITNVWQAFDGGKLTTLSLRIWPFLLMAFIGVQFGPLVLSATGSTWPTLFLGCVVLLYALLNLSKFNIIIDKGREVFLGPVFGFATGAITGVTGSFVLPSVLYLHALRLSRDELIQAMGILFTVLTLSLAAALTANNSLTITNTLISALAIVPALIGMYFGRSLRTKMPQSLYSNLFFCVLALIGVSVVVTSLNEIISHA